MTDRRKGFMERMMEKGVLVIRERLERECADAGCVLRSEIETVNLREGGALDMLSDTAAGVLGGRITPEAMWVLHLRTGGVLHWFVQPYTAMALLPGEHHGILEGSIPATAGIQRGTGLFGKPTWWSDDGGVRNRLSGDGILRGLVGKVKWRAAVPGGARVEFHAPLQIRDRGDGTVHVGLRVGKYRGNRMGLGLFVDILRALEAHLGAEAGGREGRFRPEFQYAGIVGGR